MKRTFQHKATLVKTLIVKDPDTQAPVQVSIYKDEAGGFFGIDASFLATEDKPIKVTSPFDKSVYYKI